jgi:Glycerol kinase
VGLGAPYWNSKVRGVLSGLTRNTGPGEIVRAIIESTAYQSLDLLSAMKKDGLRPKFIKIDGGMVKNNWFCQFLTDVLNVKIYKSKTDETTALGAAFMAGLHVGIFKSLNDISKKWKLKSKFTPRMKNSERLYLLKGWSQAIRKTLLN